MSRVRAKNTTPEMIVRRLVYGLGYRYRLHYKKLPGKPDLAFPGKKRVIFVHGCYWHGHENCSKGRLSKSNVEFWQAKIDRNRERDKQNVTEILEKGWKVLTIWQCELKNLTGLEEKVKDFLEK